MVIIKDLIEVGVLIAFFFFLYRYNRLTHSLNKETKRVETYARELENQKAHFIEMLIHDFKTPTLAQLRGLEILQQEILGEVNTEQKELLLQIENSCKYVLDMISMVLRTYKCEVKETEFKFESFNMPELIIECFEELSAVLREKNLEFVYEHKNQSLYIQADVCNIKTVILNLLSAAIIYSNFGEKIRITTQRASNSIEIIIECRGLRLTEQECLTMFNKSDPNVPKYSMIGQGISLYLCKKIVDCHDGQIYAETDKNGGNKFVFILPLSRKSEQTNGFNFILQKSLSH